MYPKEQMRNISQSNETTPILRSTLRIRSDPLRLLNTAPGVGGVTSILLERPQTSFVRSTELSGGKRFRTRLSVQLSLFFFFKTYGFWPGLRCLYGTHPSCSRPHRVTVTGKKTTGERWLDWTGRALDHKSSGAIS
jgi:hypothetical protein